MSVEILQKHLKVGGPSCDIEGNCRFCGERVEHRGVHLMHDPDGKRLPIEFCSAQCLHDAEHTFDHLSTAQLVAIASAIASAREPGNV